jgi:hypothetical protein
MKYFFSVKTMAFYPVILKADYVRSGSWPEDGVEVTDDIYNEFNSLTPDNSMLGADENGFPIWVPRPPLTRNQIISKNEEEKNAKITEANSFINNKQWPGKAILGRLKDDDFKKYNLWLDYLDALENIDIPTDSDIIWPKKPE